MSKRLDDSETPSDLANDANSGRRRKQVQPEIGFGFYHDGFYDEDLWEESLFEEEEEEEPGEEGEADELEAGQEVDEDDDGEVEVEFSLSQLSQAYAQVMTEGADVELSASSPGAESSEESLDEDETLFGSSLPESKFDKQWKAAIQQDGQVCPISPESIIEAMLFVGAPQGTKITTRKLAGELRDVSPKEVKKIAKELNQKYETQKAAYRILEKDNELKMVLAEDLLSFQQEYFGRNRQVRLSQAVVDVMAIVAYNQPVTKTQIENIRNKASGGPLSQLLKRKLVEV